MQPLRELGPAIDTFAMIPVEDLRHLHMDPPHPVPGAGDGMSLVDLTPETVNALVAVARARLRLATPLGRAPPTRRRRRRRVPRARRVGAIDAGFASLRRRHGRRRPTRGTSIEARVTAMSRTRSALWAAEPATSTSPTAPGRRVAVPAGHVSRPPVGEGRLRPGRALASKPPHPPRGPPPAPPSAPTGKARRSGAPFL